MSGRRILVAESDGFSAGAAHVLRELGVVTCADLDRAGLLLAVATADVLWIRLRHRIDREVLDAAPRLRVIVTPTTGLNHIDLEAARARGIEILSLRGETAFLDGVMATAEHTLALILALFRHVPAAAGHVTAGGWNRDLFRGAEIRGMTAGVVGYGRLGRRVAAYLAALGAHVLASDPVRGPREPGGPVERVALSELLARADVVTIHVPLAAETAGFFGRPQFEAMRPGAWFVNTSRGELVDEGALLDALESGRLSGAALDVLTGESATGMGDHLLVGYACRHPNLIITPHIGGCTTLSMHKTEEFMAGRLRDALARGAPRAMMAVGADRGLTCAE